MGKRKLSYAVVILVMVITGCARNVRPTSTAIEREFHDIILNTEKDRGYLYNLRERGVGESGYFYVITMDGKVVFHPETVIIGRDFGAISFIQEVLERKQGCLRYNYGEVSKLILFKPLNNHEIVCLVIDEEEVAVLPSECSFNPFE